MNKHLLVFTALITFGFTKAQIKEKGTIEIKDGKIVAKSKFTILLSDYGITVPNDYLKKISNTVELNIEAAMTPYVR